MSFGLFLGGVVAGGLGAAARYLVDLGIARLVGKGFPWGIFVINVTGSFGLGLVTGALPDVLFLVGSGFLGGYTTFSTALLDTVALWQRGERGQAFVNGIVMFVVSVAAAAAGLALGRAVL